MQRRHDIPTPMTYEQLTRRLRTTVRGRGVTSSPCSPQEPRTPELDDMTQCDRGLYTTHALATSLIWTGVPGGIHRLRSILRQIEQFVGNAWS